MKSDYPLDPLETIVRSLVADIPESCKRENGYHEWETAYGDRLDALSGCPQSVYDDIKTKYGKLHWRKVHQTPEYKAAWARYGNLLTRSTYMLPYYVCKHCFAVSEPFALIEPHNYDGGDTVPKKAR